MQLRAANLSTPDASVSNTATAEIWATVARAFVGPQASRAEPPAPEPAQYGTGPVVGTDTKKHELRISFMRLSITYECQVHEKHEPGWVQHVVERSQI